jgi:trigger factor
MPTLNHVINDDTNTAVLSIELKAAEYLPKVEKKLKEYKNKVQLKGFRTGEVPMSFLKAKFGNSILSEEIQGIVNDELSAFLDQSKLNVVGSPMPLNKYDASIQKPQDVKLDIEIGFIPQFKVKGISKEYTLPFYTVSIDDQTLDKEIDSQRKKRSSEFESEVNDIQEGDTVSVSLRESENGNVKSEALSAEAVNINLDNCSEALKDRLLKAMIGEKLTVNLADLDIKTDVSKINYYGSGVNNYSNEAEAEITEIKRIKKRDLNADFFKELLQDETVEDYNVFRERLRSAISDSFNSAVYNVYNRSIFEHLMKHNDDLRLPTDFLKRFVQETQMNGKTIENAQFSELLKQLSWGTLTNELCSINNVNVSPEDVEYEMRMAIVNYYGIQISPFHNLFDDQVKKMKEDKETYRKYYEDVQESKLFAALEDQFSKDSKIVTIDEFKSIYDSFFVKKQEKEEAEAEKLDSILENEA